MTLPQLGPNLHLPTDMEPNQGHSGNFVPLLNHAVDSGHSGVVEKLLALGLTPTPCEFHSQIPSGRHSIRKFSALHHAAWKGDAVMAELLLHNGALPHIENVATVDWGLRSVFEQLQVAIGRRVEEHYDVTPLQVAANVASLSVIELLVAHNAKTHENQFLVPNGADGDLVAGFPQTRNSKPVTRR